MGIIRKLVMSAGLLALFSLSASAWSTGVKYEYDDLGRLVKVIYDNGTTGTTSDDKIVTYTYDPAGNRTKHEVTGSGLTTDPNATGGVVVLPIAGFIVLPLPGSVVGN